LFSGWLCDKLSKRDIRWRLGVPMLGCFLALPLGVAFFALPAGTGWQMGGMTVPHAIGFYVLFGFTAVWWAAPVYASLAGLIAPHRRSSGLALFNLGLILCGAGLVTFSFPGLAMKPCAGPWRPAQASVFWGARCFL
jgi:hypothetical protein